jgi:short-subunit dehydrogenase
MPVVLILGASSDMAIAIAKKFASHQYQVQLAARRPDQLQPLQSDLQIRYNISCSLHQFDALNYNAHQGFFDALIRSRMLRSVYLDISGMP